MTLVELPESIPSGVTRVLRRIDLHSPDGETVPAAVGDVKVRAIAKRNSIESEVIAAKRTKETRIVWAPPARA